MHLKMKQQEERGKEIVNVDSVWMVAGSRGIAVWMAEFGRGVGRMLIGGGVLKV